MCPDDPPDNPQICPHSWTRPGVRFDCEFVLEEWQGPTLALIKCQCCPQNALITLQGWHKPRLQRRVFSVREVGSATVETFLHDMQTDYCDLDRHAAELQALQSSACPVTEFIYVDIESSQIVASKKAVRGDPVYHGSWRDGLPGNDTCLGYFACSQ